MRGPDTVATKVCKNWQVVNDIASREWYVEHYVGGEDHVWNIGPFDTEAEAIVEKMKLNRKAPVYEQAVYF